MTLFNRRQVLQFGGAALVALGLGPRRTQGAATPRKLALLIGINTYQSPSLIPLQGCVADVDMQAQLLRDHYGFEPRDILVLTDEAANHASILEAIAEHLVGQAQPGDIVVLHFSGHSLPVDNPGCDPESCGDWVLIPADGIAARPASTLPVVLSASSNLITRSDLEAALAPLATDQLTVVLDVDGAASFARQDGFFKGVLLAGAEADQSAFETRLESGGVAGVFTHSLTQYLRQQPGDVPLTTAMATIGDHVRGLSERLGQQTPTYRVARSDYAQAPIYFVPPSRLR